MTEPNPSLAPRVWRRLRPYRPRLIASLALLLVSVPLINFHPLVWGIVGDHLLDGTLTTDILTFWLAAMAVTYAIGLVTNAAHSYLLEKTGQAFVRDSRNALFEKFQSQSIAYHRDSSSGELVTRLVSDVDAMEQSVLQGLTRLLEECVTFVVVAAMVLWISPVVGAASILPLALAFIFIRIYNRRVRSLYDGVRKKLGNIGSFVQDRLTGIGVTQTFTREKHETAEFAGRTDAFYQNSVAASKLRNTYFPVVSAFGFINNLVMLGVGAYLIMNDSPAFSLGALLAYRGFWWRLQSPIRTIAQTSDILQKARAAARRVFELLDEPITIKNPKNPQTLPAPVRGDIQLHDVSFHYVPGTPVLDGVSLHIAPGEFVAVAGSSGAGKSTLINLITRTDDPTAGHVELDGHDLRTLDLQSLRAPIATVPQESYLFDGTVIDNLRYANPDATQPEVEAAAKAANAHHFIEKLPDGYHTHVGQNGVKLSGGQRQRLSLARAFLSQPKILLLDEPTASVEPESESLIHDAVLERARDLQTTTVLVTHRIDLLRQAPRILFFDAGKLAADGTHDQLLKTCPAYTEAYHRWQLEEKITN